MDMAQKKNSSNKVKVEKGAEALEKALEVIESYGIPAGILSLPADSVEEAGMDEESGQVWIQQKCESRHYFRKADKHVIYAPSISCTMESGRMKNIKGVKAKDMKLWLPVNEIQTDPYHPSNIHFRSFAGLSRTFPVEYYARGA